VTVRKEIDLNTELNCILSTTYFTSWVESSTDAINLLLGTNNGFVVHGEIHEEKKNDFFKYIEDDEAVTKVNCFDLAADLNLLAVCFLKIDFLVIQSISIISSFSEKMRKRKFVF